MRHPGQSDMNNQIRAILRRHTNLAPLVATLLDGDNLFDAGLSSLGAVRLMIALEDAFDVDFPESMMNRASFGSIAAIERSLLQLRPFRRAA